MSVFYSHELNTEFGDVLTSSSCVRIIIELIKNFIYYKQQIPYHFDRLKFLINEKKHRTESQIKTNTRTKLLADRQFKKAVEALETLESIFYNLKEELSNPRRGVVKELALIFGATPFTPKQVFKIELPNVHSGHLDCNHSDNSCLLEMLRSIISSSSLSIFMNKPICPTSMYVFIMKERYAGTCNSQEWFLPKERFSLPRIGQQFKVILTNPGIDKLTCTCYTNNSDSQDVSDYGEEFKSHHDLDQSFSPRKLLPFQSLKDIDMDLSGIEVMKIEEKKDIEQKSEKKDKVWNNTEVLEKITCWYQAPLFLKGFEDIIVDGGSISDVWLKS